MQDILIKAGCYIAIIIMGHLLRRKGFFGEEAFPVLSNIVIKITLPAAILSSTAGKEIDPAMLTLGLLGLGGGAVYILVSVLLNRKKSCGQRAFLLLNTSGYNIGAFAMPFTQNFLGPVGVLSTSLFDIGNAVVSLGGAYGVATAVKAGEGFNPRRILKSLATSVPFLTYLLIILLNLSGWKLPDPVLSFARIIGDANAFMAMLMIGVGFKLTLERDKIGTIARVLVTRYVIAAILAATYFFLLPFSLEVRQTLVILAFSPIGSAVPGYTAELKEDVGLSSAINSIAIIISIVIIVTLLVVML